MCGYVNSVQCLIGVINLLNLSNYNVVINFLHFTECILDDNITGFGIKYLCVSVCGMCADIMRTV